MDIPEELSQEREELLRHILNKETLSYCQERYAGATKLLLVRRTSAIVQLQDGFVRYHLGSEDSVWLTAKATPSTFILQTEHPALWGLGLHIAAEAMLALRNGHKEYVRVKKRKTTEAILS
jgi:hypothetical protein